MEKKIACARRYGLNGFIFDWYWYPEIGPYRADCLEKGFFGAKNAESFQFAVMWCNHTAIAAHPSPYFFRNQPFTNSSVTVQSFIDLTEHCIRHYFAKENYIKINGKPYFCIFSVSELTTALGKNTAKQLIADFRSRARAAGIGEIVIAVCAPVCDTPGQEQWGALCRDIGIDMLTTHAWYKSHKNEITYEYKDYIIPTIERMKHVQKTWGLPLCPSVMVGEDNSPRTVQSDIFDPTRGYPYSPIAINNKPAYVGGAVNSMLELMHNGMFHNAFLVIESWNEWTEGSYLEPCSEYGYQMLEAVHDAILKAKVQ